MLRPNIGRTYTVKGRYGTYMVPNIPAVDGRLRALVRLLPAVTETAAARIRWDIELLLDWRLELMQERGSTT